MSEMFKQLMAGLAQSGKLPIGDQMISPALLAKGAKPLVEKEVKAPTPPQPQKDQDE